MVCPIPYDDHNNNRHYRGVRRYYLKGNDSSFFWYAQHDKTPTERQRWTVDTKQSPLCPAIHSCLQHTCDKKQQYHETTAHINYLRLHLCTIKGSWNSSLRLIMNISWHRRVVLWFSWVIMAALRSRCGHYIFAPWFLFLLWSPIYTSSCRLFFFFLFTVLA